MVRRCCVEDCSESDLTLLAHRFPKGDQIALEWKKSLNLNSMPLEVLRQNFVVCTKHFSAKAYRNSISNSLNTTALPSVNVHYDNERIKTTRNKDKSKDVPLRCHKPQTTVAKIQATVSVLKDVVLPSAKKPKLDIEYFEDTVDFKELEAIPQESSEEKSETVIQIEELSYDIYNKTEDNEEIAIIPEVASICVQTDNKISQDQEVQTDKFTEQTPKDNPITESKDDKLIKLLYPEYEGKTKMDLIKLIVEKSQKIKLLEEEKQVLEDAMRKLL